MTRIESHTNSLRSHNSRWILRIGIFLCTAITLVTPLQAETQLSATNVMPAIAAPQWNELDAAQQQALHPLMRSWAELSDVQRRKWIAIVKNFPKLSPLEQAKVQERMSAWAALKPIERERARENFASSKLAQPSTKTGSWEEYQALPKEERDKLASQAAKKRASAAKTPKPVISNPVSLQPEPPHPHATPEEQRGNLRNLIAPHTLLPRNP